MIVLKFGSSVLRSERDLATAVHEVYRHVREGRRVVAVVSALGDTTDALLAEARGFDESPSEDAVAAHLATGEARAVSLLALALGRAGQRCTPVDAARIGLRTRGPVLSADPVDVNAAELQRLLERAPVVVAPGFVGVGEDGQATLLGRGGSDLTAVFLASRLGAAGGRCRLIKDVDGVYTGDPNAPVSNSALPRRYETLAWDDAIRLGGAIVQRRALELARQLGVTVEVAKANSDVATAIGAAPSTIQEGRERKGSTEPLAGAISERRPRADRPLRIGLLGLGVVGLGVYRHLAALPELFDIVGVAVRDVQKHRGDGAGAPPELLTTDPWEVLDKRPDVLVELIGGRRPAAALIEAALEEGLSVVTANKEVVSRHGARLRQLAAQHGGTLLYSAAVGGGAPVIERIREVRAAHATGGPRITGLRAAVSGTCNFILERLAAGADLAAAIREAQRKGLCEADPTLDLSGEDLAHKLSILAWEAFGAVVHPETIPVTGIGRFVREPAPAGLERRIARLVGTCEADERGVVTARIEPAWLDPRDPLADSRGEEVVCEIQTGAGGTDGGPSSAVVRARGAGRWPTAESVMADLLELVRRGGRHPAAAPSRAPRPPFEVRPPRTAPSLIPHDHAGASRVGASPVEEIPS